MHKYHVVSFGATGYECELLATDSLKEAMERAKDEAYFIERDHAKDTVELRRYVEDIEDESCECFDYDALDFTASNPLQLIRKERGMSQSQLANAAGIKVRTLQHYENGECNVSKAAATTVWRLAQALGCTMEDIIF